MKIWAHTLVKNEAKFIWYSVMSVINYVDRILLWDNGSNDETLEIIKKILETKVAQEKIDFRIIKQNFKNEDDIRQKMLDETKSDWFLVVDGDEIWWDDSISKVIQLIKDEGNSLESIVVPTINLVGDVYHYLEEKAGRYRLAGRVGHMNLRGINRKIPGLKSFGREWDWGWVDKNNNMIQNRDPKKIRYVKAPYLHATHLSRSGKVRQDLLAYRRKFKIKYELGIPFPKDYFYPEVFFKPRPNIVPSPWPATSKSYKLRAFFETPLKKIKRRIT